MVGNSHSYKAFRVKQVTDANYWINSCTDKTQIYLQVYRVAQPLHCGKPLGTGSICLFRVCFRNSLTIALFNFLFLFFFVRSFLLEQKIINTVLIAHTGPHTSEIYSEAEPQQPNNRERRVGTHILPSMKIRCNGRTDLKWSPTFAWIHQAASFNIYR